MDKPITYKFRTVEDMHAVPLDKIDHFCLDLALWLGMHKMIEDVGIGEVKVTSPRDVFGWIDDGKHDVDVTFRVQGA